MKNNNNNTNNNSNSNNNSNNNRIWKKTLSLTVLYEGTAGNEGSPLDLQRSAEEDRPVLLRELLPAIGGAIAGIFKEIGMETGFVKINTNPETIYWDQDQGLVSVKASVPVDDDPEPSRMARVVKKMEKGFPPYLVSIWCDKKSVPLPKGLDEEGEEEWTLYRKEGDWRSGLKESAYKRIQLDTSKFKPSKSALQKILSFLK